MGIYIFRPLGRAKEEAIVTKGEVLERDETWSGEILIIDTVEVPSRVTLTIMPGTMVKFKHYRFGYEEPSGPLSIVVRGTLKAVGTPKSQIWFT
jgi:hypothetical protein